MKKRRASGQVTKDKSASEARGEWKNKTKNETTSFPEF
jgi:hypothetical protein